MQNVCRERYRSTGSAPQTQQILAMHSGQSQSGWRSDSVREFDPFRLQDQAVQWRSESMCPVSWVAALRSVSSTHPRVDRHPARMQPYTAAVVPCNLPTQN